MINKPRLPVDGYLLEIARKIARDHDKPERARAQMAVTIRRRFRGTSKSDRLGVFDGDTGDWLGDSAPYNQMIAELYSVNIVKPIIGANQAAMMQARVQCMVDPTSKTKNLEGVAAVGTGIYKYINNHPDYWSNNLEGAINQMAQTDYGWWIRTYFDPDADSPIKIKLDEYSDQPLEEEGEYACGCGAGGPLFSDQMGQATDDGTIPCLKGCGRMAEILKMPGMGEVEMFHRSAEYPSGNVVQEVVSMFQIRVDERKTKNGNWRKARYLEHHFLMEEDDLQALVPYFQLGSPNEWSYTLKWEHCLETGNDIYLKPWSGIAEDHGPPPHEVRRIYLRPEYYRHYRAPYDFTLDRGDGQAAVDREGKPMLSLKAGEGLIDKYPDGFWFLVSNDRLVPCVAPCDLRDEWSYGGFLNDASSTYYQPASELNELQRVANNLWTIDIQQRESASISTTIGDRDAVDLDTLEQQVGLTKEGFYLEKGDDIQRHITQISGIIHPGPMEGMAMVRNLVGDVGGVTPAMRGEPQPGTAYAAQALQREQSLGRLTPSQFSKAEVKACVVMQHLKHAQKHRPREWFDYIATRYGEEWKEQDIEDFLNSNLELDVEVNYKEDSVVPTSLVQAQLAYGHVIEVLGGYVKMTGDTSVLKPELIAQFTEKMGVDYDVQDVDANERLADARYRKIVAAIEQERTSGDPAPVILARVLSAPDFQVWQGERHPVAIEFYSDHIFALSANDHRDELLIAALKQMVKRHQEGGVEQTQEDVANKIEAQAPAIAAQLAASQAQQGDGGAAAAKAEAETEQQRLAQDMAKTKMTLEAKSRDADAERAFKAQEAELDRQADEDKTAAELALGSAEATSKHLASQPNALQKVSESITFKDLPVAAKKDLLDQVHLSSTGLKDTQVNKPAPAKPAARPLA